MNERILDEIPYIVNPRKDTGLTNSKIGIWLFLASEVMLFGGLFSGYIFLRVYADFPWPERVLPIVPGLINTFILILSSVTVVFAWAMLKLRKLAMFRVFMCITLACAALFMGLKVVEYNAKFSHQGARLTDYTILEGHVDKGKVDYKGKIKKYDAHASNAVPLTETGGAEGKATYQKAYIDQIIFDANKINFDISMVNEGLFDKINDQAKALGSEILFEKDYSIQTSPDSDPVIIAMAGEPVTYDALMKARDLFKKARANNSAARTEELRRQWRVAKHNDPDAPGWKNAESINIENKLIKEQLVPASASVNAIVKPHVAILLPPRRTDASDSAAKLQDNTMITGKLKESPMKLSVDALDFTFLTQQAEERGIDPDEAIEKSWILKNSPELKKYWEEHKKFIAEKNAEFLADADGDEEKALKMHHIEQYKVTWKDFVRYGSNGEIDLKWYDGFAGADHYNEEWAVHFPKVSLPREQIAFESKFTPRWNNYYAIYFTITGLHGLHIIGGMIVLGYYMFCSKMYRKNPEWLANRVEVAGLFWHFVDLVWIFLFPILYLM